MSQPTTHCSYCHTAMCKGCQTSISNQPQLDINVIERGKPPYGSQKDNSFTGGYKYLN